MTLALLKLGCKYSAEMTQKFYFAGKWGEKKAHRVMLQECRAAGENKPCQYKKLYSLGKNDLHFCRTDLCKGFLDYCGTQVRLLSTSGFAQHVPAEPKVLLRLPVAEAHGAGCKVQLKDPFVCFFVPEGISCTQDEECQL